MQYNQRVRHSVNVYSSADTNAPQYSNAEGDIKSIIKACLITGYGDKPPVHGWTMPFEDGNKAVFKSAHAASSGHCLQLNNLRAGVVEIKCYEHMRAFDDGDKKYADFVGCMHSFGAYIVQNPTWLLIASPINFVFLLGSVKDGDSLFYFPMMYGDYTDLHHPESQSYVLAPIKDASADWAYQDVHPFRDGEKISWKTSIDMAVRQFTLGGGFHIQTNVYHTHFVSSDAKSALGLTPFLVAEYKDRNAPLYTAINVAGRDCLLIKLGWDGWLYLLPVDYWDV